MPSYDTTLNRQHAYKLSYIGYHTTYKLRHITTTPPNTNHKKGKSRSTHQEQLQQGYPMNINPTKP